MLSEFPHPVDLDPPDLTPYRAGNTGVPYVTRFDSGRAGPHLLLNALIHGNELCGAIALDTLLRIGLRPQRGRVTLVFANVEAYRTFDPRRPGAARFLDEDLNRVWSPQTLDGPRTSTELARARALRPVYESADILLDLHSMQYPTAPLTLSGRTGRSLALARALGYPSWIVRDPGHVAGPRLIDYGAFAAPDGTSERTALLVECGQHWVRQSARVALEVCLRLLLHYGMIDPATAAPHRLEIPNEPLRIVEVTEVVTATSPDFTFTRPFVGLEVIPRRGTLIAYDGMRRLRTPHDDCILIMPCRRPRPGQTAVRLGRIIEFHRS